MRIWVKDNESQLLGPHLMGLDFPRMAHKQRVSVLLARLAQRRSAGQLLSREITHL
jgi:hypothetical protein